MTTFSYTSYVPQNGLPLLLLVTHRNDLLHTRLLQPQIAAVPERVTIIGHEEISPDGFDLPIGGKQPVQLCT